MSKRDFKFETKAQQTASIEDVLSHEFSTNAMKLVCLLAESKGIDINLIKEIKVGTKGSMTFFRLSSVDAQKIWAAL